MEITLAHIAELVGGKIVKGDPDKKVSGAAPFESASDNDITYARDAKFLKKLHEIKAGAVIVPLNFQGLKSSDNISFSLIGVENPQVAFNKILNLFYPPSIPGYFVKSDKERISPNVFIGKNFKYGKDISVASFAVIGDNVIFGDRVMIHPNAVIGDNVEIGDDTVIYPNVTILEKCKIGKRVIIHSGTVIGSDGFGFAPNDETYHKIPHMGIVQIDDDVEIGANNAIDRGSFGRTWIQKGVKTDNLVHIAHNVIVGENTVLVAQVGISGSVTIGKHAILAGQAGIAGHLNIGNNAIVGPQAGVGRDVPDGEIVSGTPEMPHKLWLRVQRTIPKLPELKKKIEELEKRLGELLKNT